MRLKGLTPVEDSHGVIVRLLLQVVFGVLLSLFDDGIGWKLNGLDVKVLRFINVWAVFEDLASVNRDSSPSVLGNVVVAHDE